jgi:hypothetical protein
MMSTDHASSSASIHSQILDVIAKLSSRCAPEAYFNFSRSTNASSGVVIVSSGQAKIPVARLGYSVVFWFRIGEFVAEETSIFSLIQGDNPVYDILFRLTPRTNSESDR